MDDLTKKHLQDILTAAEEIDSLSADILWSIVINHLPKLKDEVSALLNDECLPTKSGN